MKKDILNCLTWMMNRVSETTVYDKWSDEFKVQEIKEASEQVYLELKNVIDVTKLTRSEAKELRFSTWGEEYPDLYLFPLWIVPLIPEGLKVRDINGKYFKYDSKTTDNDIRCGCVAYGIEIKKEG